MTVIDGRTMLELLDPAECWRRIHDAPMGRIGVLVDSAPEIYPVNFAVDGDSIVFRTEVGNKLRGLDRSPSVAFQVDGVDPLSNTGWSVLIKGHATRITDVTEVNQVRTLNLHLWAPGTKTRWIRIRPAEITGRAIHPRGTS